MNFLLVSKMGAASLLLPSRSHTILLKAIFSGILKRDNWYVDKACEWYLNQIKVPTFGERKKLLQPLEASWNQIKACEWYLNQMKVPTFWERKEL